MCETKNAEDQNSVIYIMENFEYKGYWFLPGEEDKAIAGVLTYTAYESVILELIGEFSDGGSMINAVLFNRSHRQLIHGVTSDAKKISLINCNPSGFKYNPSCSFPISRYSIQYVLENRHINQYDDNLFDKAVVSINALTMWCYPGALNMLISSENDQHIGCSISYNTEELNIPISTVRISNTTTLNLCRNINFEGTEYLLSPKFEQSTHLEVLKTGKVTFQAFLSDIRMYEQFMSLMSLSNIYASKITLYDYDMYQELSDGKKLYKEIILHYIEREQSVLSKDYLVEYAHIQQEYPAIIKKWYKIKDDIAPIRSYLINSLKKKPVFDSTDFVVISHALEGYHTRFMPQKNLPKKGVLTKRYQDIISKFSGIDRVDKIQFDIKAAVDSRNYYSHFFVKRSNHIIFDGVELFDLYKKMRLLLICCLLDFMGFDNISINRIFNNSNSNVLKY